MIIKIMMMIMIMMMVVVVVVVVVVVRVTVTIDMLMNRHRPLHLTTDPIASPQIQPRQDRFGRLTPGGSPHADLDDPIVEAQQEEPHAAVRLGRHPAHAHTAITANWSRTPLLLIAYSAYQVTWCGIYKDPVVEAQQEEPHAAVRLGRHPAHTRTPLSPPIGLAHRYRRIQSTPNDMVAHTVDSETLIMTHTLSIHFPPLLMTQYTSFAPDVDWCAGA
jgi:hypothetical protein